MRNNDTIFKLSAGTLLFSFRMVIYSLIKPFNVFKTLPFTMHNTISTFGFFFVSFPIIFSAVLEVMSAHLL